MVSRSETARALLTPGEVMQLPPDDEIVMAAGIAPIRARKARYFLDPRFTARVIDPPQPKPAKDAKPAADDWSGLKVAEVELPPKVSDAAAGAAVRSAASLAKSKAHASKRKPKSTAESQAENSGIRQEPGLPDHENVAPETDRPFNPFDPDADASQDETAQNRQAIDRAFRRNARNASLDPDDGIEL